MDKLQMVVDFLKKLNINFSQYLQASQIPEIRSNPEIADFYADDLLQNVAEDMEKHKGVSRNSFFKSFEKYKASQMGNNSVNEGKKQVKYRLTESQFKQLVSESVKKILREFDEPFPYDYQDAREREAYFERACKADFPQEGRYKIGRTWEDTYYSLMDKKNKLDKQRAKAQKEADRLKKQETLSLKKKAAADKRNSMSKCWLDAVLYTVEGDNYFKQLAIDGSTAEDDEKPEFGSKWYDGELQTPICITLPGKKVSECKFIFDATDSCEPDQFKEYMYGTYVGDSYVFSDAWGGSVDFGDGEYHGLSIEFVVRVYPNRTLEVSDYTVMWNDENLPVETRVSKYWLQDMLNKASQRNFRKIWAREKAKAAVPESM